MMIVSFKPHYTKELVVLWQRCHLTVPWNNPYQDIERKLEHSPDKFLVGIKDSKLMASVMYDYDGHRGSVAYLGIDPDFQGCGYGKLLMIEVEKRLKQLGCPKVNLMVRRSNAKVLSFYRQSNYTEDDVICLSKRLVEPDRQIESSDV